MRARRSRSGFVATNCSLYAINRFICGAALAFLEEDRDTRLNCVRLWVNEGGDMNFQNIITMEAGKRGGKPCIRGMRITVYDILSYLAAGMTTEEILDDFPYLTREDILAALSFVAQREGATLTT